MAQEESKELQKFYSMMQFTFYLIVVLDVTFNIFFKYIPYDLVQNVLGKFHDLPFFKEPIYTKLSTLLIGCLISIGTKSKKNLTIDIYKAIVYPLCFGVLFIFGSLVFLKINSTSTLFLFLTIPNILYIIFSFLGSVLLSHSLDNISKIINSNFGKDKWNVEAESFMQETQKNETPTSINIPMQFYFKKKVHDGYLNINPFRGTFVIGTPGSGKSFGIINPTIRQMISKGFTMCLYDFKYPSLAKIAYYHYCLAKQQGKIPNHKFNVINLNDVEGSCRINPLNKRYINTLAEASEISEALITALKKGDQSGGADQFFTQSAINFLSSCIYYLARYKGGKYSTLPHLLSFLNRSYGEIFTALFTLKELHSMLSPFASAMQQKAFEQLEGQIGTLKIFISRLATKESYWVFSEDDFNLKISDPNEPSILVLASDPRTQNINSALYSVVLNRLTGLINDEGNLPSSIIVDELPTIYIHKIENVISTARSMKVAVMLGLQEIPQFTQNYGDKIAKTIQSVVGNVLAGSIRNKDTLEWFERLLGKIKQTGEGLSIDRSKTSVSFNEKLDALVPAGKIANLKTGEMVGLVAKDAEEIYTGDYISSSFNCKINLDMKAIKHEESNYRELPKYYDFEGKKDQLLEKNFDRIVEDIQQLINEVVYKTA